MNSTDEFNKNLYAIAEQKVLQLDSGTLPAMLEGYRSYHSLIRNLISLLLKKRLITEDPYKHEKKLVDIAIPDSSDFKDNESASILGTRLSEYESSLDFMCNYIRFTVESLSLDRIKKLLQINSFFLWNSLSNAGVKSNSRALGVIFAGIRTGADTISVGLVNNIVSVATKSIETTNTELKALAEVQKELYKIEIRKTILDAPSFSSVRNSLSLENGVSQIKKFFPSLMEKRSFYAELVEEIIQEEVGLDKDARRKVLMNKLSAVSQKIEKEKVTVDSKGQLLECVRILGAFSSQFDVVVQKLTENHFLLQSEHTGAWSKLMMAWRKAFGLNEKTIEYKIKVIEPRSQVAKPEIIDYSVFIDSLTQRAHQYASLSAKTSPAYQKIEQQNDTAILEYVQKKISECHSLHVTLGGLDEFFKTEVSPANRSKIKGLSMELTSIKNTIVKANQRKAEYVSIVAEQEQMKKLGITNE